MLCLLTLHNISQQNLKNTHRKAQSSTFNFIAYFFSFIISNIISAIDRLHYKTKYKHTVTKGVLGKIKSGSGTNEKEMD